MRARAGQAKVLAVDRREERQGVAKNEVPGVAGEVPDTPSATPRHGGTDQRGGGGEKSGGRQKGADNRAERDRGIGGSLGEDNVHTPAIGVVFLARNRQHEAQTSGSRREVPAAEGQDFGARVRTEHQCRRRATRRCFGRGEAWTRLLQDFWSPRQKVARCHWRLSKGGGGRNRVRCQSAIAERAEAIADQLPPWKDAKNNITEGRADIGSSSGAQL